MIRRPPRSTRTDTLFPYTTLFRSPLSAGHALELVAYGGTRETTQMLSIPVFVQADPRQGGGAIDLDREYGGADLRWRWATELGDRPFSLVAGLEYGVSEDRKSTRLNSSH